MISPYLIFIKIGLLIALIGGIFFWGRSDGVKSMVPKVEAAKSEAELWKKTAENRKTLIEAQNQAVARFKAESDIRTRDIQNKLAVANSEASKLRKLTEKRVVKLETMKLPDNECEALKSLIDEARK